jgi:SprT-like family
VSTARRIRWQCPNGLHPGELGPSQPRRNALVRFCLPCSKAAGVLVERVAPALERKRQAASERTRTKTAAKRQRDSRQRKQAQQQARERLIVAGMDLHTELRRIVRLRVFRDGRLGKELPELKVRQCRYRPSSRLGYASPWDWRISISAYPGQDAADVKETIVHELVHLHIGIDRSDTAHWHGRRFQQTMRQAFRQAYGVDVPFTWNRYVGPYARALRRQEAELSKPEDAGSALGWLSAGCEAARHARKIDRASGRDASDETCNSGGVSLGFLTPPLFGGKLPPERVWGKPSRS